MSDYNPWATDPTKSAPPAAPPTASQPAATSDKGYNPWKTDPTKSADAASNPWASVGGGYTERGPALSDADQAELKKRAQKASAIMRGVAGLTSPLSPVGMTVGATMRDVSAAKNPGDVLRAIFTEGPATQAMNQELEARQKAGRNLPDALADVDEKYRLLSAPNLMAIKQNDDANGVRGSIAGAALEHPYLTGAADFIGELGDVLPGHLVGEAAKGLGAMGKFARKIPAVDRAAQAASKVGAHAASLVDRYAPIRVEHGPEGEAAAHFRDARMKAPMDNRSLKQLMEVFGDPEASKVTKGAYDPDKMVEALTRAQHEEIVKRSYLIGPDHPLGWKPYVPDAGVAEPAGKTLDERAALLRGYIKERTAEAIKYGVLKESEVPQFELAEYQRLKRINSAKVKTKPGDVSDSDTYFPMGQYRGNPVYSDEFKKTSAKPDANGMVSMGAQARDEKYTGARGGLQVSRGGIKKGKFLPPIHLLPGNALHEEFDAPTQFYEHANMMDALIEQARVDKELEKTLVPRNSVQPNANDIARARLLGEEPQVLPVPIRRPDDYYRDNEDGSVETAGVGTPGRAAATKQVERDFARNAKLQSATEHDRLDMMNYRVNPWTSVQYLSGYGRGRMKALHENDAALTSLEKLDKDLTQGKPVGSPMYRYQTSDGLEPAEDGSNALAPRDKSQIEKMFGKLPKREVEPRGVKPEFSDVRGGTFFAHGTEADSGFGSVYKGVTGGEGGKKRADAFYNPSNPLKVTNTPGYPETLGPNAIHALLGPEAANAVVLAGLRHDNAAMTKYLKEVGVSDAHIKAILSKANPYTFWDRLSSEYAKRKGYDAIEMTGKIDMAKGSAKKAATEIMLLHPYKETMGANPFETVAGGIDKAAETQRASNTLLEDSIKKSRAIQAGLRSNVESERAAAKEAVALLSQAKATISGNPNFTGNAEFDKTLLDMAQERGRKPAYMERFAAVEDAAGNFVKSVRTSGNADSAKGWASRDFTPGDVTIARKAAKEITGKAPSVADTLDLLHRAMAFDMERTSELARLVREYGSGPDALKKLSNELRSKLSGVDAAEGAQRGGQAAYDATAPSMQGAVDANERLSATLKDSVAQVRLLQTNVTTSVKKVTDKLAGQSEEIKKELDRTAALLMESRENRAVYESIQKRAAEILRGYSETVAEVVNRDWAKHPEGYISENELGRGARDASAYSQLKDFADLEGESKSDPRLAKVRQQSNLFMKSMVLLNNMTRLGIIAVPTAHVLGNESSGFLAATGAFQELTEILAGRGAIRKDKEWMDNAQAYGATPTPMSPLMGLYDHGTAKTLTRHRSELGKAAALDQYASLKFSAPNQEIVFGFYEHPMAAFVMKHFVENQGMSMMRAARETRKYLGDYNNITGAERAVGMTRMDFFYPFLKTAIRLWTKMGILEPRTITAPTSAVQVANSIQGYDDPTKPLTLTTGRDDYGEYRRTSLILPMRIFESVGRTALLPATALQDFIRGDMSRTAEDAKEAPKVFVNRATPVVGQIIKGIQSLTTHPSKGAIPPPSLDGFAEGAGGLVPAMRAMYGAKTDPAGAAAGFLGAGFTYAVPGGGMSSSRAKKIIKAIQDLRAAGRYTEADDLQSQMRAAQGATP